MFAGITASHAAVNLQVMLKNIGVEESYLYRTHDLRRGHARDLQLSGARLCAYDESNRVNLSTFAGAPLWEILSAGEWRSPAFLSYLDLHQLDAQLVIQAHIDEESDDEGPVETASAVSADHEPALTI